LSRILGSKALLGSVYHRIEIVIGIYVHTTNQLIKRIGGIIEVGL